MDKCDRMEELQHIRGLLLVGWRGNSERWNTVYKALASTWRNALVASGWWNQRGCDGGVAMWGAAVSLFHKETYGVFVGSSFFSTVLYDITDRLIEEEKPDEVARALHGEA